MLHFNLECVRVRVDQVADRLAPSFAAIPDFGMAVQTGMVIIAALGNNNFHKVRSLGKVMDNIISINNYFVKYLDFEFHHVTILYDVFLPFSADKSFFASGAI